MSRDVQTIGCDMSLGEAARELARLGVRGAPVIGEAGRCVGVLSVTDLSRWAGGRGVPVTPPPRACSFQVVDREPGGQETVLCLHAEGGCPFQRARPTTGGNPVVVCTEPHGVPTDWQVVESEATPAVVRDVMTTRVVSVAPDTPVPELARVMLDRGVHRVLVLDPDGRPVGVVSVDDLLQMLAHPEVAAPGARQ
jgi:CBS domain-containing protein